MDNTVFSISRAVLVSTALVTSACSSAQQQTATPIAPPATTMQNGNNICTVIFEKPRLKLLLMEWWPIEVISVTDMKSKQRNSDWIIEIRNVSDKPIKSVEMDFSAPPDCDAFVMSFGVKIGLGQDKYFTKPTKPTLSPGETDIVVVKGKILDELLPSKELKSCPPEKSYCWISLEEVKYADGTKWQRWYDPDDPRRP